MYTSDIFYDDEITIFSPDGRLLQVEYAKEAVKRGTTTFGLKSKDGVVLIAEKRITSQLIELNYIEKIFIIDDHIGCAVSGLVADAQHLLEIARIESQINKIEYNEIISVKELVGRVCEYKHLYTQLTGVRPFGAALLIAGADESGYHLYATDPSGAFLEYNAVSIGKESFKAMIYFQRSYKSDLSMDEILRLGVKTLKNVLRKKFNPKNIEIAVINETKKFRKLSPFEIQDLV